MTSKLGRGLEALLPAAAAGGEPRLVDLDCIFANPYQPRTRYDPGKLRELADSIRQHGMLQPLLVEAENNQGNYMIIAGERRWKAARRAGLRQVPVIIRSNPIDDEERLLFALIENIQRLDLTPMELSYSFHTLSEMGRTQKEIAADVGLSRAQVANLMRLAQLAERAQRLISASRLTVGHGLALLRAPLEEQTDLANAAADGQMTVKEVEEAADELAQQAPARLPAAIEEAPDLTSALAEEAASSASTEGVEQIT